MKYTVNGIDEGAARTYMYITSLKVFEDYFPLGPGFGTFGTDSAAKFYSPLNYHYGLNSIYGLNPDDDTAGTTFYSDTFYPLLAQFGVIGVVLFFLFLTILTPLIILVILNIYYGNICKMAIFLKFFSK